MGAVDTTYSFTATDTITSTKMNNIIDQTTMTSDAVLGGSGGSGGLDISSGKLSISANAINNSRLASNSVTSANIVDGTIVNADINASAAIAGTKISPDFGTQNIQTTGNVSLANTGSCIVQTNSGTVSGQLYSSSTNSSVAVGSVSNNPLVAFTNNTERMRITASGNVGVGTVSPQTKLQVAGGSVRIEAHAGEGGQLELLNAGNNDIQAIFDVDPNDLTRLWTLPYEPLSLGTNSGEKMRINPDGYVGIGTTTPSTKLQVNGTVTATAFSGPLTGNVTGNVTGSSGSCTGNAATATNLSTNISNWSSNGTISAVVGQLGWKNYGNGHTIFDASQSTSPSGSAVNSTNSQIVWSATYPTLMGWNGVSTYGVRVDTARLSESCSGNSGTATLATKASTLSQSGGNGSAMTFNWSGQGGQPTWLWGGNDGVNHYVYNPANFSVNYANSAGSATTASTVSNSAITAAKLDGNQSGSAPIYGVRAWVNFNGRTSNGDCTIRSSGNVSSVVRTNPGKYTVNFSTPMQGLNYMAICNSGSTGTPRFACADRTGITTSSIKIETDNQSGAAADLSENSVMIME